MSTFTIKQGDTSPAIEAVLRSESGVATDLTGATVQFIMRSTHDGPTLSEPATIDDPGQGVVVYEWQPGDTDYPGRYRAEWRAEFDDGSVETFPNLGSVRLFVAPSVGVD